MNAPPFNLRLDGTDLVDILLVALVLYALLVFLKRTHATFIAVGLVVVGVLYLTALILSLRLLSFLLNTFFAVILIALIILFQSELRAMLSRLGKVVVTRRMRAQVRAALASEQHILVETLFELAVRRIGALVVIPFHDEVNAHLQQGVRLDGRLSAPLLKSIFDPGSPGHDGAMVVRGATIESFAAHLPLSANTEELAGRGTRHAAALGMSEKTDALCIVVSEERGVVSVARRGRLRRVQSPEELLAALTDVTAAPAAHRPLHTAGRLLIRDWNLKLAALAIALPLWFFFVQEAEIAYRSYDVPVSYTGLPDGLIVTGTSPARVRLIVTAPRRKFYFTTTEDFRIHARLFDATPAPTEVTLTSSDVQMPPGIDFRNIFPREVVFDVALKRTEQ